jgi:ketosteroid isomerase-like protein
MSLLLADPGFEEARRKRIEPERYLDADDHIVVTGRFSGRASGGSFDAGLAHIWELRDGKVGRVESHLDSGAVFRALGS